ncbi:MAG: retropepsin-like domain-containing protein [Alphaproteobacteria bacterium]|nr:retropepsin-like domain-containing protein [Alphaproteobacteria bacterium]
MLRVVWTAVVFAFVCCGAARAADEVCNLQRVAVLDSKVEGDIHLMLPATFGTRQTRLLLDTGGAWSMMRSPLADQLGLAPKKLRTTYYSDVAGGLIKHYVTVPKFTLGGQLTLGESDFLYSPDKDADDIDTYGGTLGAERLSAYDIEIDNTTKTVTLYRSDQFCSGRLVRWTDAWIEIPYTFNDENFETKVTIGDDRIKAIFDTGSTRTLMDLDVAKRVFGVGPDSPGVEKAYEATLPSGKKLQFYTYRVKALTISGLTFEDVTVRLGEFDHMPLVIGMHEIAQLHLYIASKRKIIYATRREAK